MKTKLLITLTLIFISVKAQINPLISFPSGYYSEGDQIDKLYLNHEITTHIISSLNIDYIDLSTNKISGNLAKENILAIKPIEPYKHGEFMGVITIVGENFIKQYEAFYTEQAYGKLKPTTTVSIKGEAYYNNSLFELTSKDFKTISSEVLKKKQTYYNTVATGNDITITLNNIFIVDGYYFIDYTVKNKSNVRFDIDDVIYKINDKKIYKSTNSQILYLEEVYNHYKKTSFKKSYRNIVALEKFTIPNDKVFQIELKEKQISGRDIILSIEYSDFLKADVL